MANICAICGRVSQPHHKPLPVDKCFHGIGMDAIDRALVAYGDPKLRIRARHGTQVCRKKRWCYARAWDAVSSCDEYVKRERKVIDEVAALQAACGVQIDDDDAALGVGRRSQAPPERQCGTPGCALRDGHAGVCEPDKVPDGERLRRCPATMANMAQCTALLYGANGGSTVKRIIREGEAFQAQVPPWVPGQRCDRAGYLSEKRKRPMPADESERWARQRRSQSQHLLARGCLITRVARDKHLGVEMATRDALRCGDILCVLTGRIVVCYTGSARTIQHIHAPISFTTLNLLIPSIPPSASGPKYLRQAGEGHPLGGQVCYRF